MVQNSASQSASRGGGGALAAIAGAAEQPVDNIFTLEEDATFGSMKRGAMRETMHVHSVVVGQNTMVVALSSCRLLRWKVNGADPESIDIPRGGRPDEIDKIFMDPHGYHLIACLKGGDFYYLNIRSSKLKKLSNWRTAGLVIASVAFDRNQVSETTTKAFLIGTNDGKVYEAIVDNTGKDKHLVQLHQLERPIKISGLHCEVVRGRHEDKIFVLLSTAAPTRLYTFLGGPTFDAVFEEQLPSFVELGMVAQQSELQCFPCRMHGRTSRTLFALLTEHGIYHGAIQLNATHSIPNEVIIEPGLLQYSEGQQMLGQYSLNNMPVALNMSEFHFLLLYRDK